jgi:endonuclease III related protein
MSPSTRLTLTKWRSIPGPPKDAVKARLLRLHTALLRRFGPQRWWPGRTAYEIAVGAVLVQNTAWTNAARAVAALRQARLLDPRRLAAVPEPALAALIRPAGTFRLKARRVRELTAWLLRRFGGRFHGVRRAPLAPLRTELLAVPGLGPETVDAILLYAAHRPVAVADAYTRRVLARHRLIPATARYEETRAFLEAHLPSDPALLNELHALIVAVAKSHCRTVPLCEGCPLRPDLRGVAPAKTRD